MAWNEAEHPRDKIGRFTNANGEDKTPAEILYGNSKIQKEKQETEQKYRSKLLNILGDNASSADVLYADCDKLEKKIQEKGLEAKLNKIKGIKTGAASPLDNNEFVHNGVKLKGKIPVDKTFKKESQHQQTPLKGHLQVNDYKASKNEIPINSLKTDSSKIDNSIFSDDAMKRARVFIHGSEGFRSEAYKPTSDDVWTIGYGHTKNVKPGDKITREQAEELYKQDFKAHSVALKSIKVPLSDNEKIALVSLAYNIGVGKFSKSTLVKKLNAGDKKGAAEEFMRWNKQNHKVLKGLENRRKAEKDLFLTPDE